MTCMQIQKWRNVELIEFARLMNWMMTPTQYLMPTNSIIPCLSWVHSGRWHSVCLLFHFHCLAKNCILPIIYDEEYHDRKDYDNWYVAQSTLRSITNSINFIVRASITLFPLHIWAVSFTSTSIVTLYHSQSEELPKLVPSLSLSRSLSFSLFLSFFLIISPVLSYIPSFPVIDIRA